MGMNNHRNDEIRAKMARALHDEAAKADAAKVIEYFNDCLEKRREPCFVPTINGALVAGYPWMIVCCRSCETVLDFDLRVKRRKADDTLTVALTEVKCPRCNGHGQPEIMKLAKGPSFTQAVPMAAAQAWPVERQSQPAGAVPSPTR